MPLVAVAVGVGVDVAVGVAVCVGSTANVEVAGAAVAATGVRMAGGSVPPSGVTGGVGGAISVMTTGVGSAAGRHEAANSSPTKTNPISHSRFAPVLISRLLTLSFANRR
jgi:hypothetical protein